MIEDLKNLVEATAVWPTILVAILFFSLAPGLVLRTAVLLYPPGHPRRAELVAELAVVPRWQRPFWVAEAIPAPLFEGIPLRLAARKTKRSERHADALNRATAAIRLDANTFRYLLDSALTCAERDILMERVAHGRSAHEVAAQLGISAGAVRVQQHRALAKLRKAAEPYTRPAADR